CNSSRKKRRGVTIVAQAQQNQVVLVSRFTALCRQKIEIVLVFLRRDLRIDFTAHTHNRFFRNRGGRQKSFTRHSEVALSIIRRYATLVSERDSSQLPRQIVRDRGKPGVNRDRSIPAREGNPELVAFAKSLVRLVKNEVRSVVSEILRSNNLRLRFHR